MARGPLASIRRWLGARRLPGLIVPGAMKAGTTTLFRLLAGHPQLAAAARKEVHYFDHRHRRGPGWYARQFDPARVPPGIAFEASPYYMFEPRVPARVRALVPDVKLVFLLRDPVARAFSHYQNSRRLGREPLGFEAALEAEEGRLAGEEDRMHADPDYVSWSHRVHSYAGRGVYVDQLLHWRRHFPAAQMLVVDAGRLFSDPRGVVAEVEAFVGLDPWQPREVTASNEGGYRERMRPATRARLEAFFAPHERRLEGLVGWCPSAAPAARAA